MDFLKAAFAFTLYYTGDSLSSIVASKVHRSLSLLCQRERTTIEYKFSFDTAKTEYRIVPSSLLPLFSFYQYTGRISIGYMSPCYRYRISYNTVKWSIRIYCYHLPTGLTITVCGYLFTTKYWRLFGRFVLQNQNYDTETHKLDTFSVVIMCHKSNNKKQIVQDAPPVHISSIMLSQSSRICT